MKDELVERVLARLLQWQPSEVARYGSQYQALAGLKYDEYEGYRAGQGFLENFTAWLSQMPAKNRQRAAEFVLNELIFISRTELDHIVETIYPDIIRPALLRETSRLIQKTTDSDADSRWNIARLANSPEFKNLHRKVLILGLGDGAHIAQLRRTSEFSHEQFYIVPELAEASVNRMRDQLRIAVNDENALFEYVVLVDDFAGSGVTSIRYDDTPDGIQWKGRLERTRHHLDTLANKAVIRDPTVLIILYVASTQAKSHIQQMLTKRGLQWELRIVQELPSGIRVDDPQLLKMCEEHYDDSIERILGDHVKVARGDIWLGFGDGRLPLVLSHNTPNNSLSLLWLDTADLASSAKRRALFPRRHRHNAERP